MSTHRINKAVFAAALGCWLSCVWSLSAVVLAAPQVPDAPEEPEAREVHESILEVGTVVLVAFPTNLRPGDLLFCEVKDNLWYLPGGWDHVAMYIGRNDVTHLPEFVEAVPPAVRIVPYAEFYTWARDITFARVTTATDEEAVAAAAFAQYQVGKPYQRVPIPANPDPNSIAWYCSELVWAAYLSVGIDIDGGCTNVPQYVGPCDIACDDDVTMRAGDAPLRPHKPTGCTFVRVGECRRYTTLALDPQCDGVSYEWDFADGLPSWWDPLFQGSGNPSTRTKCWLIAGTFNVRVRAKDEWGNVSSWSAPLTVTVEPLIGGANAVDPPDPFTVEPIGSGGLSGAPLGGN